MRNNTRPNGDLFGGLRDIAANYRHTLGQPGPAQVAVLSSFPPRECGIATFARDLVDAIGPARPLRSISALGPLGPLTPWVIAMEETNQQYRYDEPHSPVRAKIMRDVRAQYREAALIVNASASTRAVLIQHEYGLFGGEYGEYLLDFMRAVELPIITTMHTVLSRPDAALRRVTEQLINASSAVVVLAQTAREILATYYPRANLDKVHFIPHGTPSVRREAVTRHQRARGLQGRTILSTFGLLGPDKGIEFAIRALPEVVARHPDVLYQVLGQTHPGQVKRSGESYREMLTALVEELGLQNHVRFYNRYLSMKELLGYLRATDIYVIPYLNPQQIVSGTLAYAVACGKAIVATPFTYAREMLAEGRGILAEFRDSASLGTGINSLLDDPALKERVESAAYTYGRRMHWPAVGVTYLRLFRRVIDDDETQRRARQMALRRQTAMRARRLSGMDRVAGAGSLGGGIGRAGLPVSAAVYASDMLDTAAPPLTHR
jgi:glycosyltransferase involved in cell wall biosynthesis